MVYKTAWPGCRRWKLLLLIGISVTLLFAVWLEREQSELSASVLRLHVLAHSDSETDQRLKLKVRDRILKEADALVPENATLEETYQILGSHLPQIAEAGAQVVAEAGFDYTVSAGLEERWFPTKEYEDFSLPAGRYQSLHIEIGEGSGQNWWSVIFPPLCLGSVSESVQETAAQAGMSAQQVALLTGESEGYIVKFKALELWEQLKLALSGDGGRR